MCRISSNFLEYPFQSIYRNWKRINKKYIRLKNKICGTYSFCVAFNEVAALALISCRQTNVCLTGLLTLKIAENWFSRDEIICVVACSTFFLDDASYELNRWGHVRPKIKEIICHYIDRKLESIFHHFVYALNSFSLIHWPSWTKLNKLCLFLLETIFGL